MQTALAAKLSRNEVKMSRRVVITGMGAITPIGNSVEAFWENVKKGTVGIGVNTKFDSSEYKAHLTAEVKDFDPAEYMDKKAARRMEPFSQYAVAAAKQALDDSGLDLEKDIEYMFAGGHDKAVQMLLNGDVDVCATYEGAEKKLMKDFDGLEGLEVLEYTDKIPYVCVAASKDLSDDMKQKIKEVFQNDLSSGEGKEACEKIFNLTGFVEASNDDFQNVIDTAKIMNVDLEK